MRLLILSILALCLVACGTHPSMHSESEKVTLIQRLMADTLHPSAQDPDTLKHVLLKHSVAIYYLINSPDLLQRTNLLRSLSNFSKEFERLKGHSIETIVEELIKASPAFFEGLISGLNHSIEKIKFDISGFNSIAVPQLGNSWTAFFKNILSEYFPTLQTEDRRRVLNYTLTNTTVSSDPTELLIAYVQASGPFFQKYFQLMVEYLQPGEDPELIKLKKGLEQVKDGLPPISQEQIDEYLKELKSKGYDLEIVRSLGRASVGEAFLVRNRANHEQFVMKFKKPGVEAIAAREREFFSQQAQNAQGEALKKSFENIAEQIKEEFDYTKELAKIKEGIVAYEGDAKYPIHVVRPLENFPQTDRYIAMEFIDGSTFQSLPNTPRNQYIKAILWERIARKFLKQAMFPDTEEGAFFHGDLHDGNIMIRQSKDLKLAEDASKEEVQKAIDSGQIEVVLIDFGNAHKITKYEASRLKNIFWAASKISYSVPAFFESMLGDEGAQFGQKESIQEEISKILRDPGPGEDEKLPPQIIGEAMDKILAHNISIPSTLMAFKRSLAMLTKIYTKLPKEVQDKINLHEVFEQGYTHDLSGLIFSDFSTAKLSNLASTVHRAAWEGNAWVWEHRNIPLVARILPHGTSFLQILTSSLGTAFIGRLLWFALPLGP